MCPSPQEVKAGGPGIQGQPQLQNELTVSLGYWRLSQNKHKVTVVFEGRNNA